MEGMVVSFIAEYSLLFSSTRNIVELAKEMMCDPKAANKLQVARQTTSYKIRHGLAKGLEKQLIDKLREGFFSFNIDEATSSNLHKVLTLLVSYFCTTKNEVVVEHLGSLNLPTVKSETVLFKAVLDLIKEKELPWCNLMAVLIEIKLREGVAPAPINIDGDSCHHIHNACKKFTKIFDKYLEQLYQDINNDFKWSENIRVILEDICECLSVTYRQLEMFVATRWLLVYDVTPSTIFMFGVYAVFISPFYERQIKSCISQC